MAIKTTDTNGVVQYIKVLRVRHNNIDKILRLAVGIGSAPDMGDDFLPTQEARYSLASTAFTGQSLADAYAFLKTLPEYAGAVDA